MQSSHKQQCTAYRISVVIPAYNAGKYLARAIDSVLAQTFRPHEIIVVDDGSTDNTPEVVQAYAQNVRFIQQGNSGASVARNSGINAAKGDWIAFLDADDEWLPAKLEMQTSVLDRNPGLVWVTGNYIGCICITEYRSPRVPIAKARALTQNNHTIDDFFQAIMLDAWGCTDTMLIRRDCLIEAGLFATDLTWGEDFDLWWRIAYRHPRIGYSAEPLAIYHLDVKDSAIHKYIDASQVCDLIDRHLQLAEQHGRLDAFRPCAAFLLRRWMRAMLFEARGPEVRTMLSRFGELFTPGYKSFMRLLASFPRTTAAGCKAISWFLRSSGLRKAPVRNRVLPD